MELIGLVEMVVCVCEDVSLEIVLSDEVVPMLVSCDIFMCEDDGLDIAVAVFLRASLVPIWNDEGILVWDVAEYVELLLTELIWLVEDCELLIELVLLGIIVTDIEVCVNVGAVLILV